VKINHVGIVVGNIETKLRSYVENYGFEQISSILQIENQDVRVVLLGNPNDSVNIELVQPTSQDSPVASYLKRGGGVNHICFEVDDFDATAAKFRAKMVREPRPAPLEYFRGGRTFFIYRDHSLIEFLEKK
jgi:methylmalonyl-CoA/ethylmalonyl-CoA epimerase